MGVPGNLALLSKLSKYFARQEKKRVNVSYNYIYHININLAQNTHSYS